MLNLAPAEPGRPVFVPAIAGCQGQLPSGVMPFMPKLRPTVELVSRPRLLTERFSRRILVGTMVNPIRRLRLASAVALTVLMLGPLGAQGATAADVGPRTDSEAVGHAGRWITDAEGRVVITHGVNMVFKRPPYAPDAIGFGTDDAAFLARHSFDSVRVGLIWKAVEPQPGVYDDAYLDRIESTVRMLERHGIRSLVDFHQDLYNERFQGEGAPDWAVQDDGIPAQPQAGFPANHFVMPALMRAYDHFWNNDPGPGGIGLQDRYGAAWAHVAERFRDVPGVMGYDLFNEPWPGSFWPTCLNPVGCPAEDAKLTAFHKRVITAIRTVDPDTLVWYEPWSVFNAGVPPGMARSTTSTPASPSTTTAPRR